MKKFISLSLTLSLFVSCSVVQKVAVNTTADLAHNGQQELQTMNSWDAIKAAIPAQLAFAETLIASNPHNTTLLAQLIKGNAGLGFAVFETQMLEKFNDVEQKKSFELQAKMAYTRAVNWGEKYFLEKNISWNELLIGANDEQKLFELLKKNTSEEDHLAIFFTGQAWASLINLSRDYVRIVNHLPVARNLIRYVCEKDPQFEKGMCTLFEAIYALSRPKMLGGNPDLGFKLFHEVQKKYPYNLLYPVTFIQFYLLPQKKFQDIKSLAEKLKPQFESYFEAQKIPKYLKSKNEFYNVPENNLYNSLAYIRYMAFLKMNN
jgi:hypothetical protein